MAHLFKRQNSSNWYVKYKRDGKWCWASTKTSNKSIANRIRLEYEKREAEGFAGIAKNGYGITLGEFVETHMKHAELTLSPRWVHDKRLFFKNFIIPFFGEKTPLKNITRAKIEDYRAERLKTVGNRTTNIEVQVLMTLLRHAVERDELEVRFLPRIKKLEEPSGRVRFLSQEEIQLIRGAAIKHGPQMAAYVHLMLYAGLRSGEALNLRWEDIDFQQKALHVTSRAEWTTKTKRGRTIPLCLELFEFLSDRLKSVSDDAVLIVGGEETTPYMLKRHFNRVVRSAGLSVDGENKVTAHILRHTFASHLVMNGIPLHTVAALLGHSTTATTQIYAHLAPDHLKGAVEQIGY